MQPVKLELIGDKRFFETLKRMGDYSRGEMKKIVLEAALITHKQSVDHINGDKGTGRTYWTRRNGAAGQKKGRGAFKKHVASAQGEYPATDTGQLVRNITMEKEIDGYTVGSRKGAPQGFFLEMKSPSRGGRPWLSRAFETMKSMITAKYGGLNG